MSQYRVYVCHNRDCRQYGAPAVWRTLEREVARRGLEETVELIVAGCQGRCEYGPNITVHPGATKYSAVSAEGAAQIAACHLQHGDVVEEYVWQDTYSGLDPGLRRR